MNHSEYLKKEIQKLGLTYQAKPITVHAAGETPSANNPMCFISVSNNGNASTDSSQYGLITQTLLVGIYIKLSSTGIKNTPAETLIFNSIFDRFKNAVVPFSDEDPEAEKYTFSISKLNLFGNYTNLTAGYSTLMVNFDSSYKNY